MNLISNNYNDWQGYATFIMSNSTIKDNSNIKNLVSVYGESLNIAIFDLKNTQLDFSNSSVGNDTQTISGTVVEVLQQMTQQHYF